MLSTRQGQQRVEEDESGAERRFSELLYAYEAPRHCFLYLLLANRPAVEDCLQETFMRAYERLRQGQPVTAPWLYTVARNRAMSELRRRRREHPDEDRLSQASIADSVGMADIGEAPSRLSPEDRAILYLVAVEGRSAPDIATILDIRLGATYTRISRAREHLRRLLGVDLA